MKKKNTLNDVIVGRDLHVKAIDFYVIPNMRSHLSKIAKEIENASWVWLTIRTIPDKDEFRYYFYTENLRLTAALTVSYKHNNSYFSIIGVNEKEPIDRINSVKYGIKVFFNKTPNYVSNGEYKKLRHRYNAQKMGDKAHEIMERLDLFQEQKTVEESEIIKNKEKQRNHMSWGEELKRVISSIEDLVQQNSDLFQLQYVKYEPISSEKVVGVAYKFILKDGYYELDNNLINNQFFITESRIIGDSRDNIRGSLVEILVEENALIIGFQSTVDFGKIPSGGYLTKSNYNVAYRIQKNAIDDVINNKSPNKSMLNILVDNEYRQIEQKEYQQFEKLCKAQEEAINLALNTDDFLLVQGPPGTGKTSIIVEMIESYVKKGQRILISSKGNLAVDNVLEKCIDKNISCVRLGREENVKIDKVKKRLIDRVSVEIQKDILSDCSKEELEIIEEVTNQNMFTETLTNEKDNMVRYHELFKELKKQRILIKFRHFINRVKSVHKYFPVILHSIKGLIAKDKKQAQAYKEQYKEYYQDNLSRDGKYKTATEKLQNFTHEQDRLRVDLTAKFDKLKDYKFFDFRNIKIKHLDEKISIEEDLLEKFSNKKTILGNWKESLELRQQSLYPLILNSVQVVGATCIGVDTNVDFKDVDFDVTIIDEAGQITIFDSLVPMARSKKVILIGDHMQLPPVAENEESINRIEEEKRMYQDDEEYSFDNYKELIDTSLFEKLFYTSPDDHKIMLDTQFRMHPLIAEFISQEFYEGKYKSGLTQEQRTLNVSVYNNPLYFIDTCDDMLKHENTEEVKDVVQYFNITEAEIVTKIVVDLINNGTNLEDIGVITPYKRQKREIESHIYSVLSGMQEAAATGDELRGFNADDLEIDTVDAFQGRDKNIIIFSFTRSNEQNRIGFLKELRRLNVTMTRAKYLLIMVGDSETLTNTYDKKAKPFFRSLKKYVKENGVYTSWEDFSERLGEGGVLDE